jgi:hypothetical protein
MSRSANNLILMGDQMQLGQPSQSTHPADSGLSVLDYLLHETPTIPADMGIFLGTTYHMHSAVNRFISEHIYEGKLDSHPDNDKRIIEVPGVVLPSMLFSRMKGPPNQRVCQLLDFGYFFICSLGVALMVNGYKYNASILI